MANADFGRVPLYFIPNHGQLDKRVAFTIQGRDKTVYFTPEGVTFMIRQGGRRRGVRKRNRVEVFPEADGGAGS